MGCSCSKYQFFTEEKLIIDSEKSIGFCQHNSATIDLYFRKYSAKGVMNTSQLSACLNELNIDNFDSAERPNVQRFLKKFIKGTTVNSIKLLVYGILCGNSSSEEKALLLFQVYDPMYKRSISRKDVSSLVSMIFSLCLKRCMYLFSSLFTVEETRKIVKNYIYKCQYAMPYCKSQALDFILKQNEEVDLDTFMNRIRSYKDGALMNPSDLRIVAFHYYVQKKPQKPVNLTLGKKKRKKSILAASNILYETLEKYQSSRDSKQQEFARRRSVTQKAPDISTKPHPTRSLKRNKSVQHLHSQIAKLEPSSPSTLNNSSFSSSTTSKHVLLGILKSTNNPTLKTRE